MDSTNAVDVIKDYVSIEDVIDHFGIERKQIGNRISVLCPFHNDGHFGSATIWRDKISCFVCGNQYDIFDVWMHMTGKDFFDSLKDIGETFRVPVELGSKSLGNSQEKDRFPFSRTEMELLFPRMMEGKSVFPVNYAEGPTTDAPGRSVIRHYVRFPDGDCEKAYLEVKKGGKKGLAMMSDFYHDDPKAFLELVYRKCKDEWYPFYLKEVDKTKKRWMYCIHHDLNNMFVEFLEYQLVLYMSRLNEIQKIFQKTKSLY